MTHWLSDEGDIEIHHHEFLPEILVTQQHLGHTVGHIDPKYVIQTVDGHTDFEARCKRKKRLNHHKKQFYVRNKFVVCHNRIFTHQKLSSNFGFYLWKSLTLPHLHTPASYIDRRAMLAQKMFQSTVTSRRKECHQVSSIFHRSFSVNHLFVLINRDCCRQLGSHQIFIPGKNLLASTINHRNIIDDSVMMVLL